MAIIRFCVTFILKDEVTQHWLLKANQTYIQMKDWSQSTKQTRAVSLITILYVVGYNVKGSEIVQKKSPRPEVHTL